MSVEAKPKVLKLANPELDREIGGIPIPSLTLIEGPNDCGKSVFAQQIAYGASQQNMRIRYLTTENTFTSLITQMESLSFLVSNYVKLGRLKITELHAAGLEWNTEVASLYLNVMAKFLQADKRSELFVIDSLTYIVTHANQEDILKFFTEFRQFVDDAQRSVVITLHPYAFSKELLIRIRSVCDGHFNLTIREMGAKIVRGLEIAKLRGASKSSTGLLTFQVDPIFGIKIMPFTRAKG